ncbi:MAG TPA: acyl-ACP--UDP-N-acetylglucosamine O-acyltransferase, partial [Geobacterales bacterium]|nr:acyl-ACP--UDP-N-acetylglucosamine O-acyltransferase [Geobacterales bacterium]
IGNRNQIREFTTLQPGTVSGDGETTIGDGNLFMAYCHVAHDCHVGNRIIMANGATLAGHVYVGDFVILGGLCAVHQFVRVGESAMLAGGSMVTQDVPPYCVASGDRASLKGLNLVGLKRRGFTAETITAIKRAYKILVRSGLRQEEALQRIQAELPQLPQIIQFAQFVEQSERGICR